MKNIPLIVDLDGTLIETDILYESLIHVYFKQFFKILFSLFALAKGKANFKHMLATHASLDIKNLPYNSSLIEWLKKQKLQGRKIILCTATNQLIANKIAKHLNLFADVFASDEKHNLSGKNKAQLLIKTYGNQKFDYIANAKIDLEIWKYARKAIVVNRSNRFVTKVNAVCKVSKVFLREDKSFMNFIKTIRVHQWLKNLLIFIPLFAAHQSGNFMMWPQLLLGFLAFSFCASSVYIFNDLIDLEHDRKHARKKFRPFASGQLPLWVGILSAPILLISSIFIAFKINTLFVFALSIYFFLSTAYSFLLKQLILIDCITLAILYDLRIISGANAIDMNLSYWLISFATFLFLSLAFVKRYTELAEYYLKGAHQLHGRGYIVSDLSIIQSLGIASAYLSIMVLALYLNSEAVVKLYQTPILLWAELPVLLFWLSWIWIKAHRKEMHDDPLVFAIKDAPSLISGFIFIVIFFLATKSF